MMPTDFLNTKTGPKNVLHEFTSHLGMLVSQYCWSGWNV